MHYDYHVSISNHGFKILFYDINKFIFYIYILYILHIYQDGTLKLVLRAKLFKNENKKLKNRADRL